MPIKKCNLGIFETRIFLTAYKGLMVNPTLVLSLMFNTLI